MMNKLRSLLFLLLLVLPQLSRGEFFTDPTIKKEAGQALVSAVNAFSAGFYASFHPELLAARRLLRTSGCKLLSIGVTTGELIPDNLFADKRDQPLLTDEFACQLGVRMVYTHEGNSYSVSVEVAATESAREKFKDGDWTMFEQLPQHAETTDSPDEAKVMSVVAEAVVAIVGNLPPDPQYVGTLTLVDEQDNSLTPDSCPNPTLQSLYPNGAKYYAVEANKPVSYQLSYHPLVDTVPALPVQLTQSSGAAIPAAEQGTLMLSGEGEQEVAATYELQGEKMTITKQVEGAKLSVVSLEKQEKKLVVVPVNSADAPNAGELQKQLNKIYGVAKVEWTSVKVADNFSYAKLPKEGLMISNAIVSAYSTDMNAFIKAYKKKVKTLEEDAYHLFLLPHPAFTDPGVSGYMPLQSGFGFVYYNSNQSDISMTTIAHELGHGAFTLQHTWQEWPALRTTPTQNLMDYNGGAQLWKPQWELMHNQNFHLNWFDEEEEAMSDIVRIDHLIAWVKENNGKFIADFKSFKYFKYSSLFDKPLEVSIDGVKIPVYAELSDNGTVDLKDPDVDFAVNEKHHSAFSISFRYTASKKNAFTLWTYSYDDFKLLLTALGYPLDKPRKDKIIAQYEQLLSEANDDCNKLDVIYENIPDFVADAITNNERTFKHLESLSKCAVVNTGWIFGQGYNTDEQKAVVNILGFIDESYIAQRYGDFEPVVLMLFDKLSDKHQPVLIECISRVSLQYWSNEQISNAPYYLYTSQVLNLTEESQLKCTGYCVVAGTNRYEVGFNIHQFKDGTSIGKLVNSKVLATVDGLTPVCTRIESNDIFLPAYFAHKLSQLRLSQERTAMLNLGLSVVLIEANLLKVKLLKSKMPVLEIDEVTTLLNKWENLTVAETKTLYSLLSKTEIQGAKVMRNSSEILQEVNVRKLKNPYELSKPIEDITLTKDALFLRVHNFYNPDRPWLIAIEDFKQFTSKEDLINKLALPADPTEISIVRVPKTTKVRKSTAGAQDWTGKPHQNGGAIQYEILEKTAEVEWFKKVGNVSEFLN